MFGFAGTHITQEAKWKPKHTEYRDSQQVVVTPGEGIKPPSDAIILFDGKDHIEIVKT